MKKRLLSLFCAFALLVGLIPAVAFAVDDTGQAIQFVDNGTAANIIGGQADSIYFGTYQQSSAGDTQPSGSEGVYWIRSDTAIKNNMGPYYFIEPVKWLVLKNENNELFLLSDQILDRLEYNKVQGEIKWPQSTIRSWLNGLNENNGVGEGPIDYASDNFLDTAFSDKEQEAILSEMIEEKNDNISLLSYTDFTNMPQDKKNATVTDYSIGLGSNDTKWWIRPISTYYGNGTYSMYVLNNFPVGNSTRLTYVYGVRPAFHLDLNSVLFASAAVGGKTLSASTTSEALTLFAAIRMLQYGNEFYAVWGPSGKGHAPWIGSTINYTPGNTEYTPAVQKSGSVDLPQGIVNSGVFAEKEIDGQTYLVLPMAAASATYVRGNQIFVRADDMPSGAFLMDNAGNKSTDDNGSQRLTLTNAKQNNELYKNGNEMAFGDTFLFCIPKDVAEQIGCAIAKAGYFYYRQHECRPI